MSIGLKFTQFQSKFLTQGPSVNLYPRAVGSGTGSPLFQFYEQAGRYLKSWIASPPKIERKNAETLFEGVTEEVAQVSPQLAEPSS